MLEAINLSKQYDDGFCALHQLNLTVANGEMLFLLGANGAGKTTTINLFLDFLRPTTGAAIIDGIEVARNPLDAKRLVAYLPESVALYHSLTAANNIQYFTGLAGVRRIDRRVLLDTLCRVGLAPADADRRVAVFSKGMRQKLALAIALLTGVRNLVLDEPTSGLDPVSARGLMHLLRELRDDGCAILLSTHDVFRAADAADQVVIMRGGKVTTRLTREDPSFSNLELLYLTIMGDTERLP